MPRKCCVTGCRPHYNDVCSVSVFRFPKDKERKEQWLTAINREDFTPTNDSVVCSRHFESRFIVTEDRMTRPDGSVVTAKRGYPVLTKNALPTIFPTEEILSSHSTLQESDDPVHTRKELRGTEWFEKDKVKSFADFCERFTSRLISGWITVPGKDCVTFCKLDCKEQPKVLVSFKVMEDLSVFSWHENLAIEPLKIQRVLGPNNVCNLWSKFDSLLNYLDAYQQITLINVDKLEPYVEIKEEKEDLLEEMF